MILVCLFAVAEQEEIAKSKPNGELLTWEDVAKMKNTWKVAMETLRVFPPIFGGFRKAVKDIEYGGYLIPKDWQVSKTIHSIPLSLTISGLFLYVLLIIYSFALRFSGLRA